MWYVTKERHPDIQVYNPRATTSTPQPPHHVLPKVVDPSDNSHCDFSSTTTTWHSASFLKTFVFASHRRVTFLLDPRLVRLCGPRQRDAPHRDNIWRATLYGTTRQGEKITEHRQRGHRDGHETNIHSLKKTKNNNLQRSKQVVFLSQRPPYRCIHASLCTRNTAAKKKKTSRGSTSSTFHCDTLTEKTTAHVQSRPECLRTRDARSFFLRTTAER